MANKALVTIICKDKSNDWRNRFRDNIIVWADENGQSQEGFALPEPASYSGNTTRITDEGTSVSGHLLGAVVRDDVAQVSLSWNYLSAKEWSDIILQFKGENYSNLVRFFDQTEGNWVTREMRISDRSAGMHHRDPDDNTKIFWSGCSLQLTEV